jgi:CHAT domain-containing protein/pimeloyl-ACP methyl ester carboxylesterase
MSTFIFHGQFDKSPQTTEIAKVLPGVFIPKRSATLGRSRGDDAVQSLEVANDDLIELELENGLKVWLRADDLEKDYGVKTSRSQSGQGIEIPLVLPIAPASRGWVGEWVIKGLKVFGIDVAGSVTDFIGDKVEGRLDPGPALYLWGGKGRQDYQTPKGRLKGQTDILLFLHGTASSTDGSFGGLWEGSSTASAANSLMEPLLKYFQNQVLAFQHKTLTQSPIVNALELARELEEILPSGAQLHVVSHSRGGLVGDLLCRSMVKDRNPFDEMDEALFASSERKADLDALKQLNLILRKKPFHIKRFIRVGCPAAGTTLASGRLDRYLSVILNVLEYIPGFSHNPVFEGFSALLAAVVKNRTKPEELPGLEAQMPGSPLVRLLNRPGVRTEADLHVLGGDVSGEGLLGKLKTLADWFYPGDHDLVVDTPAMLGGTARLEKIRYWIDTGGTVDHFHYFKNPDTASRLVRALINEERQKDYHELDKPSHDITQDDYRKRAVDTQQPVVYVLPGIMGSHLKVGQDRVWMNMVDLATGGLKKLKPPAQHVLPDGPIGKGYKDLIRFLASSHEVIPYAYDWRKSLLDLANEFRVDLEQTLKRVQQAQQPIRIIAHSMGGLVVRVMLATPKGKQVWEDMCQHPGTRVIMLGTPNQGSHAITAMLMGRDPLVTKLALLDFAHSQKELLEIISRFDGVLQLLPHGGELDVYESKAWTDLRRVDVSESRGILLAKTATDQSADIPWPLPTDAQLAEAKKIRELVQKSPIDPQRMLYVAGSAQATPCNIRIDPTAPQGRQVKVDATSFGDGRVPWDTGIPTELKAHTYYLECEHGDLANDPESFDGLLDLLNAGKTTKLRQTPPLRRGLVETTFEYAPEPPSRYPSEADLIAAALGSTGERPPVESAPKVQVRVIHGNLQRATSPLLVGHYEGDTIVSAEAVLDMRLDGRLRERHALHIYPDKLHTTAVFLTDQGADAGRKHPGAIIVGLGMVGDLTPGSLATTVGNAVTRYMLRCVEQERERRRRSSESDAGNDVLSLSLSSLLIGTGGAGLKIADSLQSVLRGVLSANHRFVELQKKSQEDAKGNGARNNGPAIARIDSVEIIELWEDLAIQTVRALLQLGRSAEFRDALMIEELLVKGVEGHSRVSFDEAPGWWQRMRITQEKGALKFEALTDRSRAETYLHPTQRTLVESFLNRAVSTTANDPELSSTLFELIIPNRLKEYATDRRNLALVLDDQAAAYPWELLHDRLDHQSQPLSVAAGMIRQLTTSEFREDVLHGVEFNALVVGDPTFNEPTGKFAPLPGAAAEARAVAKFLRDRGYQDTVELVEEPATPQAILMALYSRSFKLIHLAGHGVFEFPLQSTGTSVNEPEVVTGMVLGEGMFLTPAEIEQMRFVPELVFVNCCHLGSTRGESQQKHVAFHRLASNLATQLIRMGVRAVVAAGWAVNDDAAKTFAKTFYEALFNRRTFGDAVRLAREETYIHHPGSNTWGAYQCYGDPDFALTPKSSQARLRLDEGPVAAAELRKALENIIQRAKSASAGETQRLREHVINLTKGMGADWTNSSAMCAALGQAYGEVGLFEEAVRFYDRGRALQPADATVESLEQLANLKVRWALDRVEQKNDAKDKKAEATEQEFPIEGLFKDAENILDGLLKIHETQERFALKGKMYKGRAILSENAAQRRKALREMKDWYDKGYECGKNAKRNDAYYPLANRLAAEIVLSWEQPTGRQPQRGKKKGAESLAEGLAELSTYAKDLIGKGQSFWDMSLAPDQKLLEALYAQRITANDQKEIFSGYLEAKRRGGSAREIDSVIKNIRFFESMVVTQAPLNIRQQLSAGLKTLRESLVSDGGANGEPES